MRAVRTSVIAGLLLAGCSFHSSSAPTDGQGSDGGMIDGATDGEIDAPPDVPPDAPRQDFGTGVWTVHVSTLPTDPVQLPGSIQTDTSTLCSTDAAFVDPSQPDACFIVGTTITMTTATTNVRGDRPLVLVATDSVTIDQKLDVASHRGQNVGPGGNWSGCGSPTSGADRTSGGGGGGAGGSFMTAGGNGGTGDNGNALAGTAQSTLGMPAILHGGCPGSRGGDGQQNAAGVANGGGAIYIVAANSISVTGLINASGSGVAFGGHGSGGGGGGSGGMIVLSAPQIDATGLLLANGGGGSSGGDSNSDGMNGSDEMIAMPLVAPPGGAGPGGPGGNGFTQGTGATGGGNGNSDEGGGGGGGGAGFIGINVAVTGGTYTPSPTMFP
jgi:hypothetical protein